MVVLAIKMVDHKHMEVLTIKEVSNQLHMEDLNTVVCKIRDHHRLGIIMVIMIKINITITLTANKTKTTTNGVTTRANPNMATKTSSMVDNSTNNNNLRMASNRINMGISSRVNGVINKEGNTSSKMDKGSSHGLKIKGNTNSRITRATDLRAKFKLKNPKFDYGLEWKNDV